MANTNVNTNVSTTMTTTDRPGARVPRERHVARSARILSTGLSATAILGITAAFGAAERASSAAEPTPTTPAVGVTTTPIALAPLGASSAGGVTPSAPVSTPVVSQLPSPVGTITLPTGAAKPAGVADAPAQGAIVTADAVLPTVPVVTPDTAMAPVAAAAAVPVAEAPQTTVAATVPATVAPIAPAEPAVELTLPPPPSNGSSGGSR